MLRYNPANGKFANSYFSYLRHFKYPRWQLSLTRNSDDVGRVLAMDHQLKTWPEYFQATWVGDKTFEIRKNDRDLKVGDEITLQEYDPKDDDYTGREIHGVIRYLTNYEQKDGYVVFSLCEMSRSD